jgi:uncharacterized protein DUF4105
VRPWIRRAAGLTALGLAASTLYCGTRRATGDGPWRIEQSRAPRVTIAGGKATIRDIRRFVWRTADEGAPGWFDGSYDLAALDRATFYLVPLNPSGSLAHVFVSFGFGPATWLAVSVEARRRPKEDYKLLPALLKRYELIYVIADERDIVNKRALGEGAAVYAYPVRVSREALRRFFLQTMERAEEVAEHPEMYGVFSNTCASNVAVNAQRAGSPVRINLDVLMPGALDRVAYATGALDTDLSFPEAKRLARVDLRLRALADPWSASFFAAVHRPLGEPGPAAIPEPGAVPESRPRSDGGS